MTYFINKASRTRVYSVELILTRCRCRNVTVATAEVQRAKAEAMAVIRAEGRETRLHEHVHDTRRPPRATSRPIVAQLRRRRVDSRRRD